MECNHCHKPLSFFKQYYVSSGNRYCMECAGMFTDVARRKMKKESVLPDGPYGFDTALSLIRKIEGITPQQFHILTMQLSARVFGE